MNNTDELTPLSPFLKNHFCADYKEDVRTEIAHNNYHCARRVLANPGKYPKANVAYLEEEVFELSLFWPEVLFQEAR